MNSSPAIVFLVSWPLTARDAERFGFALLENRGLRVRVFDATRLAHGAAKDAAARSGEAALQRVEIFTDLRAFDAAVAEAAPCSVFVDFMRGLDDIDLKHARVYRSLARCRARMYVVYAGGVPLPSAMPDIRRGWHVLRAKLIRASDARALGSYVSRRLIARAERAGFFPRPYRVFASGSDVVERYLRRRAIPRSAVTPINSFDFDEWAGYIREHGRPAEDGTCVFLDEGATGHPDDIILNTGPLEAATYWRSMARLFDAIEARTGLLVRIAGHPRMDYSKHLDAFGGREIVTGRTVELVSRASLVVAHASTSVAFAVLFDRPLLIVRTDGMTGWRRELVEAMAASLGTKVVNVDVPGALEELEFDCRRWPDEGRERYKRMYVMSPEAGERTTWEIVADAVAGDIGPQPGA